MYQIVFAGVGGQGIVLASKLVAEIFMSKNYRIKTTETIGMAQRGGSVTSHLRASMDDIHSPFVPVGSTNLLLGFEPAEALRNLRYAGPGSKILVHRTAIKPITDTLSKTDYDNETVLLELKSTGAPLYICDFSELFEEIGSDKPLNIALVGAALGLGIIDFTVEETMRAMEDMIPGRHLKINLKALDFGHRTGKSLLKEE